MKNEKEKTATANRVAQSSVSLNRTLSIALSQADVSHFHFSGNTIVSIRTKWRRSYNIFRTHCYQRRGIIIIIYCCYSTQKSKHMLDVLSFIIS